MRGKRRKISNRIIESNAAGADIVQSIEDEGAPTTKSLGKAASDSRLSQLYESTEFKVVQERNDFLLHQILDFVQEKRWINLTPEYQRRKRWDNQKKSLLIESLLMNLPVPPIFLYEVEPARYEVMDGQQRLNAIIEFYDDQLPLSGLETWKGLVGRTYTSCPPRIKRGIDRRKISAVILSADTSNLEGLSSKDIRREVFERLNTGGEKLNAQELRNCLYSGPMNELIIELSRLDEFTDIWNIPSYSRFEKRKRAAIEPRKSNNLYKTMADSQIVLRFFAFREKSSLKGSVRAILDQFMETNQSPTTAELRQFSNQFESCLSLARNIFEGDTFRLPESRGNKLSVPLYDAVMIALYLELRQKAEILHAKRSIISLLSKSLERQKTYETIVGKPNTASAIQDRINHVRRIIRRAIAS